MDYVWGKACSALGLERRPPEEAEPDTSHVSSGFASVNPSKVTVSMQKFAFSYQSETVILHQYPSKSQDFTDSPRGFTVHQAQAPPTNSSILE